MNKMTIRDIALGGKRVLVRVDFNVPLDGGRITDTTRIRAALPTLRYILDRDPQAVILMSHLGRPKGERVAELSLAPVAPAFAEAAGAGCRLRRGLHRRPSGRRHKRPAGGRRNLLLENTRFHAGETKNDPRFAAELAAHGDVFVNDAFGAAHRAHASNVGVSARLTAVAGLLLEQEINYLATALEDPPRPFVAILGGAKVSGKIEVIDALLGKVDKLLVGGGMANTFFAAQGRDMADSLVETEALDIARGILDAAGDKLVLPVDQRIADAFENDAVQQLIAAESDVPRGWQSLDIGPATVAAFTDVIQKAPGRSYGMDRWASSSCRLLLRERWALRRRLPTRPRRAQQQSSVAATRRRLWRASRLGGADVSHFDRWRRQPGIARGQDAAGHCRAVGAIGGLSSAW